MKTNHNLIPGFLSEDQINNLLTDILPVISKTKILTSDEIKFAEIGVYMGKGTTIFNQYFTHHNIKCRQYAIDHFKGSAEHNTHTDYWKLANHYLEPIIDNIKLIKNDSITESKNYPKNFFDIVYIDASHDYDSVEGDIINWLPLIREGGVICGDDYTRDWPDIIRAVDTIFNNSANITHNGQWWVEVTKDIN